MENRITRVLSIALLSAVIVFSGCAFQQEADRKFGDQHFKTALALIELHKIRFGEYPASLNDLKFVGEWDQIALNGVAYQRLDKGYELNVVRGWVGKPQLQYPPEFWQGLGLVKSNMKPN